MAEAFDEDDLEEVEKEEELQELHQLFSQAATYLHRLVDKLKPEELLRFYGFYKLATEGPCNIPKPGFYQVTAKQKWEQWKSLGNMSREQAMLSYIDLLNKHEPEWQSVGLDEINASLGWVSVSRMTIQDEKLNEDEKTVFDWVKEGDIKKVCDLFKTSPKESVNIKDSDGLGLIHWAADRGNLEMLKCLVCDIGASLNLQDSDGQTPLHYAASCGHEEVVKYLIDNGADPKLTDNDGHLPVDVASSKDIEKLFDSCVLKDTN